MTKGARDELLSSRKHVALLVSRQACALRSCLYRKLVFVDEFKF